MSKPACQSCGTAGAKGAVKLDPRTYQETRKLLCARCRGRLGYTIPIPARAGAFR